MMRKSWGGLSAAMLLVGLLLQSGVATADSLSEPTAAVRLLAVEAVEQSAGTALQVRASGAFRFTSYQPHARNLIVDLAGVVADPATLEPAAGVTWMGGYRLLPFRNARGRAVMRLDINLKQECDVELTQTAPAILTLTCPQAAGAAPASARVQGKAPLVAASLLEAQPSRAPSSEPVQVRRFVVHEQADMLTVNVQATAPLSYETMILNNPTRLVIDLPQSILLSRPRQLAVDQAAVVGVRMAQFKAEPPITRLVVDLLELVPYEVEATPEGLRLTLQYSTTSARPPARQPEPARPIAAAPVTRAPAEKQEEVPEVPEEGESESQPVLLASLAPTIPGKVATPAAAGAIVEPAKVAGAAATLVPMATSAAAEEATPSVPEAEQAMPAEQPMEAEQRFSGEPISVNLKDVDLKDFFRLIHEISGLNIVVDPNVAGSVTLVLIDVPWDQALDIVLKNNGLGSTLEGNVLRIATLETLKTEQQDAVELAQARAEAVDPVTRNYRLSYARASDLEAVLQRFLSSRGELIRDERTNTIIIRDIPSVIPQIEDLINQLDRKSLQVEIEARVVSASRAFAREIGSQFATSFATTRGRSTFGGALGESPFSGAPVPPLVSGAAPDDPATGAAQPLASDFRATATSGFLFGHRSPNFALDIILTAAESRNIAKVLSKPRLITQNNIQAVVKQGTRIPVQTVVNNTISTQFIDVVLQLTVTPQITIDGTVFLDVDIENTAIDTGVARINGIPALSTQRTTTQVLVRDGGTVVIGGVMTTNNSTSVDQVPLLGSIPLIGHLFKRTSVSTSTQELLFFITPRIVQS